MSTVRSGSNWAARDGSAKPPTLLDANEDGYRLMPSQGSSTSLNENPPRTSAAQYGPASNLESLPEQNSDDLSNTQSRSQYSQMVTESASDPSVSYASEFACSWPTCALTFTRLSERDRHYVTDHANNRDRPYKCEVEKCQANVTSWTKPEKLRRHNKEWHGPYHCQVANCARGFPCGFSSSKDLDDHVRSRHKDNKQDHEIGPDQLAPVYRTTSSGVYQQLSPSDPMAQISSDNGPERYSTSPSHSGAEQITRVSHSGSSGHFEKLDKNYAKRSSDYKKFFRPGRVFSTLWTEPYDDSMQSENDQFRSVVTYEVSYMQRVFSKIRRFVVVKMDDRSCTCLPVTTYDGKGYKKRGINLNDHGLIYSSRDPPLYPDGISKRPLKIILSKGAENLVNPSYLHYGRLYTVETNVKVRDVGVLDDASKKLLRSYYKSVQFDNFSDDDEGPGLAPNPQQRAVSIAGVGSSFANSMPNHTYDSEVPRPPAVLDFPPL